jgi:DNA-binding beta-propeller fold protein YncE
LRRHAKAPSAGSSHGLPAPKLAAAAAAGLLSALLLALSAAPALAGTAFVPAGSLDGSATANGSFSQLLSESVAVNGKNGHILIADSGLGIVYDYDSLADASPAEWDGSATPAGSFGGGRVAVAAEDSSGDVYVLDATHAVVVKLDESGAPIASFGDTAPSADGQLAGTATPAGSFEGPLGLAVDQESGKLHVVDSGHGVVDVFDSTGAYLSQFDGTATAQGSFSGSYADGIAVDDANSHVYVSDSSTVQAFEFDLAGNFLADWNGSGTPAGSFGGGYTTVTADNASGQVYVSDTASGVVDAFDQSGLYLRQITGAGEPRGLAVEQASGKLYVSDNSSATVRVFEEAEVQPPAVSIDPVTAFTATTAHFSGTVDPGTTQPDEASEYRFSCVPQCPGLQEFHPLTGSGTDQLVEEDAGFLEPNTSYEVLLEARNAQTDAEGQPVSDATSFGTATAPPTALTTTNSPDGSGGIEVRGSVNPQNSPLDDCHFEFGLTEAYGQSAPCEGELPQSGQGGEVSVDLTGLQAGSTYHYKVVASSSAGPGESADGTFVTSPPAGPPPPACPNPGAPGVSQLPDCRAWELVSPVEKNGGYVTPGTGSVHASVDGGAVAFEANVAFADAVGTGAIATVAYRADRQSAHWSVHAITPPQEPGWGSIFFIYNPLYRWFSPDLSRAVLQSTNPDPPLASGAQEDISNLYLTDGSGAAAQLVTASEHPLTPGIQYGPPFEDATENGSHVVFRSAQNLTADTEDAFEKLYEWDATKGVRLAGVMPDGAPAPQGAELGAPLSEDSALSSDGSHLYFTTPPDGPGENYSGRVYLRKDDTTNLIAESEASSPDPTPRPSRFWVASADGSRAFFTSYEPLTDAAAPSVGALSGGEAGALYMYADSEDPEADSNLTLISTDAEPADGLDSRVSGVLAASEDGTRVYFAAEGALVPGQPIVDGPKLYLWDHGLLRYITTLGIGGVGEGSVGTWSQSPGMRTSRATPDGRYLLYATSRPQPGGYDNAHKLQIYRYDALTSEAICISCNPSGAPPSADTSVKLPSGPYHGYSNYAPHALSRDGRRVFFNSSDPLVPQDSNGRLDVYQWQQGGDGGCSRPEGCLSLISGGKGGEDSFFGDASADGADVYFLTRDRLSRWDVDGSTDLYDARVNGGLPEPAAAHPQCEGDACQPPPVAPIDATPASSSFSGAGNPSTSRKCHRKRVRKAKHHGKRHRPHAKATTICKRG